MRIRDDIDTTNIDVDKLLNEDHGGPMLITFDSAEDSDDPKTARYNFGVTTAPKFENDLGRWVGDLTLTNINPYTSRELRRAIAEWQARTGRVSRDEIRDDDLTWTVEEFLALL